MKKYSKKELKEMIQEYANITGKSPKKYEIAHHKEFPPVNQFLKNFKNWNNFLRACNLKLNSISLHSKQELLNTLKNFAEQNKRTPKMKDFANNKDLPCPLSFFRHFGSWNNALIKAGLKINIRSSYTKKELLSLLKKKAKEIGRAPNMKEMKADQGYPSGDTYKEHFGSWNNALKKVGLKVKFYNRKWTKKELLEQLKKKYRELGKTPSLKDFDKDPETPGKNTVRKSFGSWTNALREANIPLKKYNTKKDLIKRLQMLAKKLNRTPTITDLKEYGGMTEVPFVKKFKSYTAACLSVGLIPNKGKHKDIWYGWEKHCVEIAKVIHKNVEIRKDNIIEGIPDIYIKEKNLFIDAKTCGYKEFREQVKKYCKKGHKLEFWCIFKGMENRSKKVRYRYAEELANLMKKYGKKDLAAKCYQFINNIYSEGQTTLK